jgi:hypothetical protein
MNSAALLDSLPLWLSFALTVALILLAVEAGYRAGIGRVRKSAHDGEASIDALVGSTLGLLAFMLAFTFGMATSRFDARKQFVLDEAVVIRTADLRAQLLPEPHRSGIRTLLREYVDARLQGALHPEQVQRAITRSEQLQDMLWSRIASFGADVPGADRAAIAAAVAELIAVHSKRLNAAIYNRIHGSIWTALYGLAVLAMGMMGYGAGISGRRNVVAIVTLAFAFSAVLLLIADLDRPQQGLVRVSQQAMLDLQTKLAPPPSGAR